MADLLLILGEVVSKLQILYLGVFLGYLFIISPLKRFRSQFNWITINFFTPFLILVSFQSIRFSSNLLYPVVSIILVTGLGYYFPKFMAYVTKKDEPDSAELCTAAFPNALNFPFPVIDAFAPDGLGVASIFLGLSIIARNSVGFYISGSKMEKESLKKIILFPPIWAIVLGAIVHISNPNSQSFIDNTPVIGIIFQAGIFATLMTVGFGLSRPKVEYLQPILRVSITRLVVMFVLGLAIISIFHPPLFIAIPFIVQLSAPPAVYNGLYAEILGLDTKLTSQVIVTITMIALIFLPFQLFIIQLFF